VTRGKKNSKKEKREGKHQCKSGGGWGWEKRRSGQQTATPVKGATLEKTGKKTRGKKNCHREKVIKEGEAKKVRITGKKTRFVDGGGGKPESSRTNRKGV